jgi:hypothetical protein
MTPRLLVLHCSLLIAHLLAAQTTVPLIAAAVGTAISVKIRQNFELFSNLANKADCLL